MFTQKTYKYIKFNEIENLKAVLDSGVQQVIINSLLSYAIKNNKLEAIKLLLEYCADFESYYQGNLFNLKNYGTRNTQLYIDECVLAKRSK